MEAIQRFQLDISGDLHDYYHSLDTETKRQLRNVAQTLKANGQSLHLWEFVESAPTDYHLKNLCWTMGQLLVLLDWIESGEDRTLNSDE